MNATGLARRPGFTLVEALAEIVVVVVLAALVIPTVVGRLSDAVVRRQANDLAMIAQGINRYHDDVGAWPSSLTQLVVAPVTGDPTICGTTLAQKNVAHWQGPYLTIRVPAGGISIGNDVIAPALSLVTSPLPRLIQISLLTPGPEARAALQAILDTDSDPTAGTIRWTSPAAAVTYNIPIAGC